MKKKATYTLITLLILLITISIPIISNADIKIDPNKYVSNVGENSTKLVAKANIVIGTIQAAGSIIAVIALLLIGIKYMLGSAEEKADFKSSMLPYIVGCVMLILIVNIVGIIYKIATKF